MEHKGTFYNPRHISSVGPVQEVVTYHEVNQEHLSTYRFAITMAGSLSEIYIGPFTKAKAESARQELIAQMKK